MSHDEPNKSQVFWNNEAKNFDKEADHGLTNPVVRSAWTILLKDHLPEKSQRVLDVGCGTGSLSVILAELGHQVVGIDFASAMIEIARQKATTSRVSIQFQTMDAHQPDFPAHSFDFIICRHVLWALNEPEQVLQHWVNLLVPNGSLLLVEGFWSTGAGLHADYIQQMMPEEMMNIQTFDLSDNSNLWGKDVQDKRYIISATVKP